MAGPRRTGSRPPGDVLAIAIILAGIAIGAGLALIAAGTPEAGLYVAAAGLALAATSLWIRLALDALRDRDLRRLALALEAAAAGDPPRLAEPPGQDQHPMAARLHRAAAVLVARASEPSATIEARLSAILAVMPQAIVVINDNGLVTLVNRAAADLLGADRVKPGTSVFNAIDRDSLAARRRGAAALRDEAGPLRLADGASCTARLRELADPSGCVIAIDVPAANGAGLAHALHLHDAPPPPRRAPNPDTPLSALDVVVLDCESTGLNVGLDRILSIGAVRMHGTRIRRQETIDFLIDPGQPIPPASTRIHGITDAMVRDEKSFAERWPEIEPMLRDCVVVGHNIGFDLTLLEAELRRARIAWKRPPSLCTLQLAAALEPGDSELDIEALARAHGIEIAGRHTALGDALVTAEIYLRQIGQLQARGDTTFAAAQARAATARRVIRQQQAAGW